MAEVRCEREPWRDGIELLILEKRGHETWVAERLVFKHLPEGNMIGEPTVRLKNQEAQMLIDELWRCGLRPSEGTGSAGSLAATERHLADMQKIAMDLLEDRLNKKGSI